MNRNWSTYFALFKDDETSLSLKQKFVKFSTVWHRGLLFYPFNFPSFGVLKLWYTHSWRLAPKGSVVVFYQILSLIVAPVLVGIVTELFSHWLKEKDKDND